MTFDEEKTLFNLKSKVKEQNLIITKADKGNATVITEKNETHFFRYDQIRVAI